MRVKFVSLILRDKKPEEWIQVENVHEPLVDMDTYNLVQENVKIHIRAMPLSRPSEYLLHNPSGILVWYQEILILRYNLVQEKVKMRKRPDAWGNYGIFAGLVKCGECGSTLNQRVANAKAKTRILTCAKYNRYGVAHCSQHRLELDTLCLLSSSLSH